MARRRYVSPYDAAVVYAALGEKDLAFQALERAFVGASGWMAFLHVEPMLDPLRPDPRFAQLLRRIGLGCQGSVRLQRRPGQDR